MKSSRRKFIGQLGGASMLLAAGPIKSFASVQTQKTGPNDKIRVATIGMGIMG